MFLYFPLCPLSGFPPLWLLVGSSARHHQESIRRREGRGSTHLPWLLPCVFTADGLSSSIRGFQSSWEAMVFLLGLLCLPLTAFSVPHFITSPESLHSSLCLVHTLINSPYIQIFTNYPFWMSYVLSAETDCCRTHAHIIISPRYPHD